ncbi:hypothetical protein SAMN05444365_1011187 [Micromonospora pattaloongensis]|uniref:Uncharacterized protein n=1 Tax=Micromonospora pattaloongensis TaxID=405436 RepID=A0A1H3IBN8_9ACTN|nr:hypothetical protein SAMN05444365_1011187 [Micromonospora pattaloongensis]
MSYPPLPSVVSELAVHGEFHLAADTGRSDSPGSQIMSSIWWDAAVKQVP